MNQEKLRNRIRANLRSRCLEAGLSWERVKAMDDDTLLLTAQQLDRLSDSTNKKQGKKRRKKR